MTPAEVLELNIVNAASGGNRTKKVQAAALLLAQATFADVAEDTHPSDLLAIRVREFRDAQLDRHCRGAFGLYLEFEERDFLTTHSASKDFSRAFGVLSSARSVLSARASIPVTAGNVL